MPASNSVSLPFKKVCAANSTQTGGFVARADTLTEPTGDNIVPMSVGGVGPTWASLEFFGTTTADTTFKVKIYGVRRTADVSAASWTFTPIFEGLVTLGTKPGIAGGAVLATDLYADTLVVATEDYGTADNSFRIISPADNTKARLLLDTEGYEKLCIDFDRNASAVSCNALCTGV